MNIQPGITVPVAPGPNARVFPTNIRQGNAGNGGQPNPPTIVPQMPGTFPNRSAYMDNRPPFVLGAYNNAEESFVSPTRYEKYWNNNYYSNNPVGAAQGSIAGYGGPQGNAGNGGNDIYAFGAGFTPRQWSPYELDQLGVHGGYSQSYAYNKNQTNLEGGVTRVWDYGWNVNMGEQTEVTSGTQLPTPDQFRRAQEVWRANLNRAGVSAAEVDAMVDFDFTGFRPSQNRQ